MDYTLLIHVRYHCDMELRHLRYFIAVAEELHFGRAATRLGIAQPPLSMQIRDLEREIGVRLLSRTHRRVELTDAGRVFLDGARRALTLVDATVTDAQRTQRGELGQLRLGFVSSATYATLPQLLRVFRERYPDVRTQLEAATTSEQVAAIRSGSLDIGLLRLPRGESLDPTLDWRVIAEEPLMALLPAEHPAVAPRVSLAALAHEPFILYPRADNPQIYDSIINVCREAGLSPYVAQESGSMQVMTALVASGMGVALVIAPPGIRDTPDAVFRPLAGVDVPVWSLALAWRRASDLTPTVHAFLATASETLSGDG